MRFKCWRAWPEVALHIITLEDGFEDLPVTIRHLGPWQGSWEGELDALKPHYRALLEEQGFAIVYASPSLFQPWQLK